MEEKLQKNKEYLKFYEQFPEPYRTQAIENLNIYENDECYPPQNAKFALEMGFIWRDTLQRHDYWSEFKKTLK